MRKKPVFFTEAAYAAGLLILALGAAFMERADLGMSMVVAPAYLIHLKVSELLPFYTFGMSEYVFQAVLIAAVALIMRRFKKGYLFSFVTAVVYGFTLDGMMALVALLPMAGWGWRIAFFTAGVLLGSVGVALLFHAYIPPEAYELFVKEIAGKSRAPVARVKTFYDIASCVFAVALSFAFFGFGVFRGVRLGTVICAAVNGPLIGLASKLLHRAFGFRDGLPRLRAFFER